MPRRTGVSQITIRNITDHEKEFIAKLVKNYNESLVEDDSKVSLGEYLHGVVIAHMALNGYEPPIVVAKEVPVKAAPEPEAAREVELPKETVPYETPSSAQDQESLTGLETTPAWAPFFAKDPSGMPRRVQKLVSYECGRSVQAVSKYMRGERLSPSLMASINLGLEKVGYGSYKRIDQ